MLAFLKNQIGRLVMLWFGLSLFAASSLAGTPRKSWKIVVFRAAAPYAAEIESALKSHLTKLGYVAGRNLTYLMRRRVMELAIPHGYSAVAPCVTVSLGVAARVPDECNSVAELLETADSVLYQAKHAGRNRVRQ